MQIPAIVCCAFLRPISHSVSLATIGVCVFCAVTSVAALFVFKGVKCMENAGGVIKIVCFLIAVICFLSVIIPQISEGLFGPKICKIYGCPNEVSGGKYCFSHECINFSCDNKKADGFSYCEKCLKKAGYDLDY